MKWWIKHQKGSQEPKMLHPSLVTLSIHFFPEGICFSIHKMGKRWMRLQLTFPLASTFIIPGFTKWTNLTLGTQVVSNQAPSSRH